MQLRLQLSLSRLLLSIRQLHPVCYMSPGSGTDVVGSDMGWTKTGRSELNVQRPCYLRSRICTSCDRRSTSHCDNTAGTDLRFQGCARTFILGEVQISFTSILRPDHMLETHLIFLGTLVYIRVVLHDRRLWSSQILGSGLCVRRRVLSLCNYWFSIRERTTIQKIYTAGGYDLLSVIHRYTQAVVLHDIQIQL